MNGWKLWLAVAVIFVSGLLIGAFASYTFTIYRIEELVTAGPRRAEGFLLDRLSERLELSQEKKREFGKILKQTFHEMHQIRQKLGPQYAAIWERAAQRMKEHLSSEQKEKLDVFMEEMRARRSRWGNRPPPPPFPPPRPPMPRPDGN